MNQKQYDALENAPDYVSETAELLRWSENYDFPSPGTLFLDLIGYSGEQFGAAMYDLNKTPLGYLEAGMLADALNEWADRADDVYAWVEEFFTLEDSE